MKTLAGMGFKEKLTAIVFTAIVLGGPAVLAGAYSSPLSVASHHISTTKPDPKLSRRICTVQPNSHRHA